MINRRDLLQGAAWMAGAAALGHKAGAQTALPSTASTMRAQVPQDPVWMKPPHPEPGEPGRHYRPTVTLNGSTLPWKLVGGVKVMHLTCDLVQHEFSPKTEFSEAVRATCWGYNGQVHGPTIECVEGDRLRIYVTNNLPAPTSVHWHGLLIPSGMDGVGGLSQQPIAPGETFMYEFTLWQQGTYMYHSHHDEMTQMALGMLGMIVIHPREPQELWPERDFVYLLSEWKLEPGTTRPDPNEMTDFNLLTLNGKVYPGTAPMLVKQHDRVRIRVGNLSAMDHHPIHFHGHKWWVTGTDGGPIPESARQMETTVLVPVGTTRTVEFVANNPGDWAFHCHMTHHVMNQMGHGIPNLIGVEPGDLDKKVRGWLKGYMTMGQEGMHDMGEMGMKVPRNSIPMVGSPGPHGYITMGGMYTNIKVRADLESYERDPGWYQALAGTQAGLADLGRMEAELGYRPAQQAAHQGDRH